MIKNSFPLNQGCASERVSRLRTLATIAHLVLLCTSARFITSARLHLSPLITSSSEPPRTVPLLVGNFLALLVINHQINLRWRRLCRVESHKVFFHPLRTLVFKHWLETLRTTLTTRAFERDYCVGQIEVLPQALLLDE